ncbi:hypothetical protein HK097_003941 [Rhizophlyctis rosea]|uniref:histone acetyltransferase n=1 Tax=Rhizophlyctis rosea TaxID=64517 RepID=A0AAD5SEF1_9FUNG|nr:hypothetical protein HK097_003941 [Rhizophlyctis rosea]
MAAVVPSRTLEDFIVEHLHLASFTSKVRIRVAEQESLPDTNVLPNQPTVRHDILILISVLDASTSETFVFGLCANRYISTSKALHYIEKIDTTTPPPSLARAVVRGYVAHALHASPTHETSIHIFARPQPQYLFPKSADNVAKRKLSGPQLVRWWLRTVTLPTGHLPSCDRHWIVPGLTEREAERMVKPELGSDASSWRYGWSHNPTDDPKRTIPRFPDDAKTRVLEMFPPDEPLTLSEFTEVLAETPECSQGNISGFITIVAPTQCTPPPPPQQQQPTKPLLPQQSFQSIFEMLMTEDFSTLERAKTSTAKITALIDSLQPNASTDVVVTQSSSPPSSSSTQSPPPPTQPPTIMNLQNLVKRKPADVQGLTKKTDGDVEAVHNVQSLVRKRDGQGGEAVTNVHGLVKNKRDNEEVSDVQSLVKKKKGLGEDSLKRKDVSGDDSESKKQKIQEKM